MFCKVDAAKIFVVFDAISFVNVFFSDSNSTKGVAKCGGIDPKFDETRIAVIFNKYGNIVVFDSILVDAVDV